MSNKSLSEVHESVQVPATGKKWKRLFAFFGPAYLVSVGYMDPGNWATDLAGGSKFGYSLIWVLLMSNLMALLLQSLSARLGIVTGLDLAQASKRTYPRYINWGLYILAEIAIAACDLAEVIGMAIGLNLLFGLPLLWGVSLTVLDTFLLLFLLNSGMRKMEAFIIVLVCIIGVSFILEMFIVKPVVSEILQGFTPSGLSGDALYIAIGIIGATVMPHNLYLHSALVQTRKFDKSPEGLRKAIKYNNYDSAIALNLAFFVNAAILILAATAFHKNGFTQVAEIQDAHKLLENIFGSMAPALFAIALIAAGQSSTITGTLAGQIIMEGYLNLRLRPWLRRILTRALAIIPAILTIVFFGERSLGALLVLSQAILSLQLGFAMIPLIHFVSNKNRMKEHVIPTWMQVLGWLCTAIIVGLNLKLVVENVQDILQDSATWVTYVLVPVLGASGFLLIYILVVPFIQKYKGRIEKVPHGFAEALSPLKTPVYDLIAITIDFSDMDQVTIEHAVAQGGKQSTYLLIHIVETAGARILGAEIYDFETQSDIANLDIYAKSLTQMGHQVKTEVGYGSPTRIIPEIILKSKAKLLVMGAHGHSGLKDVIFGETVDSVRHQVNVPVFIVKR
jgi:manganese transport protein